MSDTGSNDPYDPDRPSQPEPRWGVNPPPPPPPPPSEPGGWGGGQPGGGQPGAGQYGQPPYGQPPGGQYGQPYGQPYGQSPGSPPSNYLVPAILATVFCCLPLGIASIVFAAQVNGKYAAGDIAGAQESSRKAKQFAIWSVVAGVVVGVLYLGGILALAGFSGTS